MHCQYLLARAYYLGNRKVAAFFSLSDVVTNEKHSVEDRVRSYLHLARLHCTLSSNRTVDKYIIKARELISLHAEQLDEQADYFELLCQFELCQKYLKLQLDFN